jgi:hypothetical protein
MIHDNGAAQFLDDLKDTGIKFMVLSHFRGIMNDD